MTLASPQFGHRGGALLFVLVLGVCLLGAAPAALGAGNRSGGAAPGGSTATATATSASTSSSAGASAPAATTATSVTAGGSGSATNPLSGFPQATISSTASATPTTTIANSSTSGSGGSLSGTNAILIAIAALVVLVGISFFIWRDARRRAPVRGGGRDPELDAQRRSGSKPPPRPRKLSAAERKRRKRGRAKR